MESSNQRAEREAAQWLSRRDGDAWTARDGQALNRWLDESTAHAVAFIRLEAAWRKADRFGALGAGFPPRTVPTPEQFNLSPFFDDAATSQSSAVPFARLRMILPRFAAAALLVVVAAASIMYLPTEGSSYRTPVGGIVSVPMKDGSRVTLNTDSEIHVALGDTQRWVELERGEAFFEVAKDPRRPFIVSAGSKRVVVLGTQFSIRREGDDVRVVVSQGSVRVEDAAAPKTAAGSFVLSAGGVARVDRGQTLVQSKPLPEVEEALSWRLGFLVLRNANLSEALAEFNRYNDRKILIADPALAEIHLSGKFKATNIEAFVRLLEDGFPIAARQSGERIVLTAAP